MLPLWSLKLHIDFFDAQTDRQSLGLIEVPRRNSFLTDLKFLTNRHTQAS